VNLKPPPLFDQTLSVKGGDANSPTFLLPRALFIEGNIAFDGELIVTSMIKGNIRCRDLKIEKGAGFEGTAIADTITVAGRVEGRLVANRMILSNGCDVTGEILHRALTLDRDAHFEGKSRRLEEPVTLELRTNR